MAVNRGSSIGHAPSPAQVQGMMRIPTVFLIRASEQAPVAAGQWPVCGRAQVALSGNGPCDIVRREHRMAEARASSHWLPEPSPTALHGA